MVKRVLIVGWEVIPNKVIIINPADLLSHQYNIVFDICPVIPIYLKTSYVRDWKGTPRLRDLYWLFLFIVRTDWASGRDFYLAAERAELSVFEFYCIFERIGAREEWSQARYLWQVTLGCVRWLLETRVLGVFQGRRSAPLGGETAEEPCHYGMLSSQVA